MRRLPLLLFLIAFPFVSVHAQNEIDCAVPLEIWQVQGAGMDANCIGQAVTLSDNIVTGVGTLGFFIQTPPSRSDNDPATSDGLWVFTNYPPLGWGVKVGDGVTVMGRIKEFYNLTQIDVGGKRNVIIGSPDNAIPEPLDLYSEILPDAISAAALEQYEGMRVQVTDALVVSPTNQFDEFGISLTGKRAFREPGIEADVTPKFAGQGLPEWDLNYEIIEVDPPEMSLPVEHVTVGSTVSVVGHLAYAFQDYQIWATEVNVQLADFALRPVRAAAEGEYTIATQNLENLYDLVDDANVNDGPREDYVPDTPENYALKLRKWSAQIREALGAPDIVAVQEVENINSLTDLAEQIAADDAALVYEACLIEGNDPRGIDSGYLWRADRVTVQACEVMPGGSDTPGLAGGGELHDRPPLVLEATLGNMPITLINLHIKSLSGNDTAPVQQKRLAQAVQIAEYVQMRQSENPAVKLAVLGDLNGFQFSDGLVDVVGTMVGNADPTAALAAHATDIVEPNLIEQMLRLPAEEQYSYIFNHNLQVLDHVLATTALDGVIVDVQFSRGNADGLKVWELEDNGGLGSSDHDGFVIYVKPG
jgi:uncharacterized protein